MPRRADEGIPVYGGISIADGSLDTTGVEVIKADTTDFIEIDDLYFIIPDDVTAVDLDVNIDSYFFAAADVVTVHDEGTITDLRAIWTWENPNPPTGFYMGLMKLGNVVLEPDASQTDHIMIIGNDATDADNYTSTGATAMNVVARGRKIAAEAYE
jgi:hypothetical protein